MRASALFAMSVCAWAQIEHGRVGMMLDEYGGARPVWGVPGSATLGDAMLVGVKSLSCSAQLCLAKSDAAIVTSRGETVDAPAGPAIFAWPYVYFAEARSLVRWQDGQLEAVTFEPVGEVLSLGTTADGFDYAVRSEGEVWIEHYSVTDESYATLDWIGPANAVLLLESGVLIATDNEVRLNQTVFDLEGVTEFVRMGGSAVEAVTAGGRWVIDLEAKRVFLLPGVPE